MKPLSENNQTPTTYSINSNNQYSITFTSGMFEPIWCVKIIGNEEWFISGEQLICHATWVDITDLNKELNAIGKNKDCILQIFSNDPNILIKVNII
jgi:hypothetical protein